MTTEEMIAKVQQSAAAKQNVVDGHRSFDNTQAFTEGWGLFNGKIRRLDAGPIVDGKHTGRPRFEDDKEAYNYVTARALNSTYHRDAIWITIPF